MFNSKNKGKREKQSFGPANNPYTKSYENNLKKKNSQKSENF